MRLGMKASSPSSAAFTEISQLLDSAFSPSRSESSLMVALRESGREVLELVLRTDGRISAHIAFTRAYRESTAIGYHLATVAVRPELQRIGLGTALIADALQVPKLASSPIFVLGDPRYYARFGFQRVASPKCPFDPSNEHFQALRWHCDDVFTVGYEPEFQTT